MMCAAIFVFLALLQVTTHGVNCENLELAKEGRALENINGSLYFITPSGIYLTVVDGWQLCNDLDMRLVSLDSADKEAAIMDVIIDKGYTSHYWTSGIRVSGTNTFLWSGTGRLVQGYTNWDAEFSEPTGDEDCIIIQRMNNKWWDNGCDFINGVICEE